MLLIFITVNAFAFSQETAIKIYLEDGFSHKCVKNAKVTLEGFELPPIIGKYNKKGHFYYFDSIIPNGYNTVMAYHKKYNEKGFQEIGNMPNEILLKLYPEYNTSYDFLESKYRDDIRLEKKNGNERLIQNKGQFKDIYVEDLYKVLIVSMKEGSYRTKRDTIYSIAKQLGLIPVNPYIPNGHSNMSLERLYPECLGDEFGYIYSEWLDENPDCKYLPIRANYLEDYVDTVPGYVLPEEINRYSIFIYKKKDGTKFQRFNDPVLKKLVETEGILVYTLVYEKLRYRGKNDYNFKKFKKIDEEYQERLKLNENALYPTIYFNEKMMLKNHFKLEKGGIKIVWMPGSRLSEDFIMVPISFKGSYGLGVLDNMDYHKEGSLDIRADYKDEEYSEYYESDGLQVGDTEKAFWRMEDYINYKNKRL